MDMTVFLEQVRQGAVNSSWLELVAVLFGLASVMFATRENILVYPTGIVNVLIYVYICAIFKLYADMAINAYYFVMSVYGWILWGKGENRPALPITFCSNKERWVAAMFTVISFCIIYFTLVSYTDSDVPVWDALTTSLFVVAMVLMAKKKMEHWIGWILGNIISVPLYLYKGLAFTAVQYLVFTGLAVMGYLLWRKSVGRQNEIA